jgi:hypothetical protein
MLSKIIIFKAFAFVKQHFAKTHFAASESAKKCQQTCRKN